MENTKDLEPSKERIIALNQKFHPFDPSESHVEKSVNGIPEIPLLSTKVVLEIGNLKIPLRIHTIYSRFSKAGTIAPFNPELGDAITEDDYDEEKRAAKIKSLQGEYMDFPETLTCLNIDSDMYSLKRYGLNRENNFALTEFPKEILPILRRLRLQTTAGSGFFESKFFESGLASGTFYIHDYYPIDAGQMQKNVFKGTREGFTLALPTDPEKLATIGMKFVLAKDPNEREESSEPVQL